MAHPQNTPRGLFSKWNILIPAGKGFSFSDYSASTPLVTADSTGVVLAGKIKLSSAKRIGANSTGFIFDTRASLPSTRSNAKFAVYTNSTGNNAILVNTTGTTWRYLNTTSVLPT